MTNTTWITVCTADTLEEDDVVRFDWEGHTYAVYRTTTGVYATDGICTHEHAYLSDGLVMDNIIECPLHQGRFDVRTGEAKSSPVCVNLKTYPAREENGEIQIELASVLQTADS